MRDIQLTRVEDPEGVRGGVVDVEVIKNQERKGKNREQVLRDEGAIGGGP